MASSEASMENSKAAPPSSASNCVLLSSWFSQNPFLRPLMKPNLPSPNSVIRDLHTSPASTPDICLRFLHVIASQNPILNRILSFSSDFNRHLMITQASQPSRSHFYLFVSNRVVHLVIGFILVNAVYLSIRR